jgi:hypothetical protein
MSEKIYPKGLRTFPPRAEAPEFVKGTLIITLNEFIAFCKNNSSLLTDYNGQKQLKMNMLEGDKGLYLVVDTWKPEVNANVAEQEPVVNGNVDDEPLPF